VTVDVVVISFAAGDCWLLFLWLTMLVIVLVVDDVIVTEDLLFVIVVVVFEVYVVKTNLR
jgi:hypothetical protein